MARKGARTFNLKLELPGGKEMMMKKIKMPMRTIGELSRFLLWWWGAGRVSASFFFFETRVSASY
jgi:hypothetical protein